jgi:hypothetical protein
MVRSLHVLQSLGCKWIVRQYTTIDWKLDETEEFVSYFLSNHFPFWVIEWLDD